jgi:hypothetical protein
LADHRMLNGALLILVAYTVVDEEEEVLRIISARRVTRRKLPGQGSPGRRFLRLAVKIEC